MEDVSANRMNQTCACKTLDENHLAQRLESLRPLSGYYQEILQTRPHLFSTTSVFISLTDLEKIQKLISAIEATINSTPFQQEVLRFTPEVAQKDFGPQGVFTGYDFHLTEDGPRLIEINTNAGGAYLNAILASSQNSCHETNENSAHFEEDFYQMFLQEWTHQRRGTPLRTIAIVDENPESQFLYPEFLLFKNLFESHNIKCVITDSKDLSLKDNKIYLNELPIDLIYNRMTDFYFELPQNQLLKLAYLKQFVVVTPNPYHHALYANKQNLVLLSQRQHLETLGLSSEVMECLLQGIPRTEKLTREHSDYFWENRKHLFFKPARGYGSKATYRGDKITKKVWTEILGEDYVAQEIAPPGQRLVKVEDKEVQLKLDIRAYVYQGKIQLLAARLYEGQTTNFRTSGGGFAPVYVLKNTHKSNT